MNIPSENVKEAFNALTASTMQWPSWFGFSDDHQRQMHLRCTDIDDSIALFEMSNVQIPLKEGCEFRFKEHTFVYVGSQQQTNKPTLYEFELKNKLMAHPPTIDYGTFHAFDVVKSKLPPIKSDFVTVCHFETKLQNFTISGQVENGVGKIVIRPMASLFGIAEAWPIGDLKRDEPQPIQPVVKAKHSHYYKDVSNLSTIDVYRVLQLFNVTDPCLQHAVKKLLVAGGRGAGKDINKDIQESIDSLKRWQEMRSEESEHIVMSGDTFSST